MPVKQRKKPTRRSSASPARGKRKTLGLVLWTLLGIVALAYGAFLFKTLLTPYTMRWKAIHGKVAYPKGDVRGIDVSRYQKDIDWEQLRNSNLQGSPVSFVFIKATEGKDYIDPYFNYNFFQARQSGIIRGAYHFFSTQSTAKAQAEFFCRTVQLEPGDLPPVLDVEEADDYSVQHLQCELLVWLDSVESYYDVKPIIYTSRSFKKKYLCSPRFDEYPLWIAHYYVDSLTYKGPWQFWQHTDVGRIEGIDHYVDVNLFNGTYDQLLQMTIEGEI